MTSLQIIGCLTLLLSPNAIASNKTVVEGVPATNNAIFVSSTSGGIAVGTSSVFAGFFIAHQGTNNNWAINGSAAGAQLFGCNDSGVANSEAITANPLVINTPATGNVGINTASPGYGLDVSSTVRITGNTLVATGGGGLRVGSTLTTLPGIFTAHQGTDQNWSINGSAAGAQLFGSNDAGTANSEAITANPLVINALGGNVGIGTTNPSSPFHVVGTYGNIIVSSANASNTIAGFELATGGPAGHSASTNWGIYNNWNADGDLSINTSANSVGNPYSGTNRFYINSSGNVGIGTTNPGDNLNVKINSTDGGLTIDGNGAQNTHAYLYTNGVQNAVWGAALNAGAFFPGSALRDVMFFNAQPKALRFGTNGTENLTILNGGNVGIGDTNPPRLLSVAGATRFEPTTQPSSLAAGDCWTDSSTNKFSCYNGSAIVTMDPHIEVWSSTYTIGSELTTNNASAYYPIAYRIGNRIEATTSDNTVLNGLIVSSQTIRVLGCVVTADATTGSANTVSLMKNGSAVSSCSFAASGGTTAPDSCFYDANTQTAPGDKIDIRLKTGSAGASISGGAVCYMAYQVTQ